MNLPNDSYRYAKLTGSFHWWHFAQVALKAYDSNNVATTIASQVFNQSGEHTETLALFGSIPNGTVKLEVVLTEYYGATYINDTTVTVSTYPLA